MEGNYPLPGAISSVAVNDGLRDTARHLAGVSRTNRDHSKGHAPKCTTGAAMPRLQRMAGTDAGRPRPASLKIRHQSETAAVTHALRQGAAPPKEYRTL